MRKSHATQWLSVPSICVPLVTTGAVRRVKFQSNHHHQQTSITQVFTGRMPLLSPNQQSQSTEGLLQHATNLSHPKLTCRYSSFHLVNFEFIHTYLLIRNEPPFRANIFLPSIFCCAGKMEDDDRSDVGNSLSVPQWRGYIALFHVCYCNAIYFTEIKWWRPWHCRSSKVCVRASRLPVMRQTARH